MEANIRKHFGDHVRGTVNLILNVKERAKEVDARARREGWDPERRHETREREVWGPARRVKQALGRLEASTDGLDAAQQEKCDRLLQLLRSTYRPGYRFRKKTFYYDCKKRPREHARAMIALARFRAEEGMRTFRAIPMHTSHVPGAVQMDDRVVGKQFLRNDKLARYSANCWEIWGTLLTPDRREIKAVSGKTFQGVVHSDGISCSFIKKPPGQTRAGSRPRGDGGGGAGGGGGGEGRRGGRGRGGRGRGGRGRGHRRAGGEGRGDAGDEGGSSRARPAKRKFPGGHGDGGNSSSDDEDGENSRSAARVEAEGAAGSRVIRGRAASRTAGTAASAEANGVDAPQQDRAGAQQPAPRRRVARRRGLEGLRYIEDLSPEELQQLGKCVFIDPGRRDLLYCMHEDSSPEKGCRKTMRVTRKEWMFLTRSRKFRRLRERLTTKAVRKAEQLLATRAPNGAKACDVEGFLEYLRVFGEVEPTLREHYAKPIYRKLRLLAYTYRQKAYAAVVKSLREFANGATLVIGDCSPGMARYQEPMPHVELLRVLVKAGFKVLLTDEYCTSQVCPDCHERSVETFRRVPNPRPYRREQMPTVVCHGLLRCTTEECHPPNGEHRIWGRNLMACLNMRHIKQGLEKTGERPEPFQRPRPQR